MHPYVSEGLHLFLRWAHLIAGIMWIGSSIFFHWLDSHLEKVDDPKRPGLEGVLWMVHSGGFYEVEKKLVAPSGMPKVLHWFKWEAGFTYLTGFFLLVLLYHVGGGAALLRPGIDVPGHGHTPLQQSALCFGTMIVAWFAYDFLWSSRLSGKSAAANPLPAVIVSVVGLAGIALMFAHFLPGRAAYIHTAAVMGTCMVLNVWVRIIPAQQHLVESVRLGRTPDAEKAYGAKRRSKHNHYMTYPVVFIMISNHFPSTYGALSVGGVEWNWVVLMLLMAGGGMVKWWMNWREPGAPTMLAILGVCVAIAAGGSLYAKLSKPDDTTTTVNVPTGKPITASGRIKGIVKWSGAVPPPRDVQLMAGCELGHPGGKVSLPVAVVDQNSGALAEAFVHITTGVDGYAVPPAPTTPIVVEQRACLYVPRTHGVRVGQPVELVNDDAVFHNVRSVSTANQTFSINQPDKGQRDRTVFRMPEVMVQTRCDVHPWMIAHVGVKEHPWFAVTGVDGAFTLEGVPAGDVVVEVWHEGAKQRVQQQVTVPANGEATIELVVVGGM